MAAIRDAYTNLRKYFGALEQTGYSSPSVTKATLIHAFMVGEVLDGPLSRHLEDKDVAVINRLFNCLAKQGCLTVTASRDFRLSEPRGFYMDSRYRVDEVDTPRIAEGGAVRMKETD